MAVESGLGFAVSIDDSAGSPQDIVSDIFTLAIRTPSGLQDISSIDVTGFKRLALRGDAEVVLTGGWNDAANKSHAVFKDYRTILAGQVGRTVSLVHSGQTLALEMVIENYDVTMSQDGSLVWTATLRNSDGVLPAWS